MVLIVTKLALYMPKKSLLLFFFSWQPFLSLKGQSLTSLCILFIYYIYVFLTAIFDNDIASDI